MYSFILLFFLLLGSAILTAFSAAIIHLGKYRVRELLKEKKIKFFYAQLQNHFFKENEWLTLNFALSIARQLLYLVYAAIFISYFYISGLSAAGAVPLAILLLALSLAVDATARLIVGFFPQLSLKVSLPIAAIYLTLLAPITFPILKLLDLLRQKTKKPTTEKNLFIKSKIMEMISDSGLSNLLDGNDQRMLASFITFRQKTVREIMIPKINIFGLRGSITVKEAGKICLGEDYSRIPVYKENLDNVLGVLMYKDVLKAFATNTGLEDGLQTIMKPVIFTPENKKISHLFQEFRAKRSHIAIVVNEYGNTEGLITLEDILEELVGEIADEYDIGEERQFWKIPEGKWIVDAKMTIIDIEDQLHIRIPHSPEYETIGGFVFHKAGFIPPQGWQFHQDEFDLEVLSSDERHIEKIRINPHQKACE